MSWQTVARIGRDWVHDFNKRGMEGPINDTSSGRPSKLFVKQKAALKDIVEGPGRHSATMGEAWYANGDCHPTCCAAMCEPEGRQRPFPELPAGSATSMGSLQQCRWVERRG